MAMSHVDIGFLEECESWEVESRLFPSKVGGNPAWLELEHLPSSEDIQCNVCKRTLIFLCQIYAPYEEDDGNFHRTVFVFICRNSLCCRRNSAEHVKVFRNSLRRDNKFYSFDPPVQKIDPEFDLSKWVTLCNVCGCEGKKKCGKCKEVFYCSKEHQVMDWKEQHKICCGIGNMSKKSTKVLFPEREIIIEPEDLSERNELKRNESQCQQIESKMGTMPEISEHELQAFASVCEDKAFLRFQKRISDNHGQVVRYDRGGQPLWIANEPKPTDIPNCEYCFGPRQFEFQIMPQMISALKDDSLDWGVLVVYTCKNSCNNVTGYKREYIFEQDVANE